MSSPSALDGDVPGTRGIGWPWPAQAERGRAGGASVTSDSRNLRLSALMAAAQAGDSMAYEALLRDCVGPIAAVARREGVRGADVDDVVQDTLLTIHRARATYDPARSFMPWLTAIAQRRAIDLLRQTGRRHAREVHDAAAYDAFAETGQDVDAGLDQAERASRLRALVVELPPRQREAVDRLSLAEETLDQASRLTGRSKIALKVNLHRGLKALRSRLKAGGREDV